MRSNAAAGAPGLSVRSDAARPFKPRCERRFSLAHTPSPHHATACARRQRVEAAAAAAAARALMAMALPAKRAAVRGLKMLWKG
jgi:hypothetical protein